MSCDAAVKLAIQRSERECKSTSTNLCSMLSLIDWTSLNETDTPADIELLCERAKSLETPVAAICIYSRFVSLASRLLSDTPICVATVVNFPSGDAPLAEVVTEINQVLSHGAEEIDVVLPYKRYLAGESLEVKQFISACKKACDQDVVLKVILETGAFPDLARIQSAVYDVCDAGADFVKTSTGKYSQGASLEAASAMLLALKELQPKFSRPLGIKISGGIRRIKEADAYLALATHIMGAAWIQSTTFRFGTSRLIRTP